MIDTPVPILADNIRSDMNLVNRIDERANKANDWNKVDGFLDNAPYELKARLTAAFPGGHLGLLDLLTDGHGELFLEDGITINSNLTMEIVGVGGPISILHREFNFINNTLYLEEFRINSSNQNSGIGTRILLSTYEAAKRLHMKIMRLTATEIGSYVWTKAGFLADRDEVADVLGNAMERLGRMQKLSDTDRQAAEQIISGDQTDPKAMWQLSDLEDRALAQYLLVNNPWDGSFAIGDPEQEARLKEYAKARGVAI